MSVSLLLCLPPSVSLSLFLCLIPFVSLRFYWRDFHFWMSSHIKMTDEWPIMYLMRTPEKFQDYIIRHQKSNHKISIDWQLAVAQSSQNFIYHFSLNYYFSKMFDLVLFSRTASFSGSKSFSGDGADVGITGSTHLAFTSSISGVDFRGCSISRPIWGPDAAANKTTILSGHNLYFYTTEICCYFGGISKTHFIEDQKHRHQSIGSSLNCWTVTRIR